MMTIINLVKWRESLLKPKQDIFFQAKNGGILCVKKKILYHHRYSFHESKRFCLCFKILLSSVCYILSTFISYGKAVGEQMFFLLTASHLFVSDHQKQGFQSDIFRPSHNRLPSKRVCKFDPGLSQALMFLQEFHSILRKKRSSFPLGLEQFLQDHRDIKPSLTVALEDFTSKPSITFSHTLEVLGESYQAMLIITDREC